MQPKTDAAPPPPSPPPPSPPPSPPHAAPPALSPDLIAHGYRFVKWTGGGGFSGHYPANILSDPVQGTASTKVRVKFLDVAYPQSVAKSRLSHPLTDRQTHHLL
jgi:hypothetical protein